MAIAGACRQHRLDVPRQQLEVMDLAEEARVVRGQLADDIVPFGGVGLPQALAIGGEGGETELADPRRQAAKHQRRLVVRQHDAGALAHRLREERQVVVVELGAARPRRLDDFGQDHRGRVRHQRGPPAGAGR
jgi:hypothetical protein